MMLSLFLITFALSIDIQSNSFNHIVINGMVCFQPQEAKELGIAYEKLSVLESKIVYYKNMEASINEIIAGQRKQKIKFFFNGVAIGSGVSCIAFCVALIKTLVF